MSTLPPSEPPRGEGPDPQAIEGYVKYLKKIARQKLGTGRKPDIEASDLVNEVILEMVRRQEMFESIPPRARPSWLRRVLLNRLTDYIRRAMAQRNGGGRNLVALDAGPSDSHNDALLDPQETPSRIVSRGEEEELLRAAIDSLSEIDRKIILARDFEGLDFATIGGQNNLSAEAARKRHERAVARLAEKMIAAGSTMQPA